MNISSRQRLKFKVLLTKLRFKTLTTEIQNRIATREQNQVYALFIKLQPETMNKSYTSIRLNLQ